MERLLITGIAGGQGRLVASGSRELRDDQRHRRRTLGGTTRAVTFHRADLRSKKVEDVFKGPSDHGRAPGFSSATSSTKTAP